MGTRWTRSAASPSVVKKTTTSKGEITPKGKAFLERYYGNVWHQIRGGGGTPMTRCGKLIPEWWLVPIMVEGERIVLQEGERFCNNCAPAD
jgi:hypothetical protein